MNNGGLLFLALVVLAIAGWTLPTDKPTEVTPISMQTIVAACENGDWESFNPTIHKVKRDGKKVDTIDVTCRNGNVVRTELKGVTPHD